MNFYLLLFGAFLLQEPVSTNAVLLQAYQSHANVWLIHLLFVTGTVLDAIVFYYLGKLTQKRFSETRFMRWLQKQGDTFLKLAGKRGEKFAIIMYGWILFPWSAFIAPWLDISFKDSLIYNFISDLIFWYGSEWLLVLGVKSFIPDPRLALYAIVIISTVLALGLHYLKKRGNLSK